MQLVTAYKSSNRKVKAGEDLFSVGQPHDAIYSLVDGWAFLYSPLRDGERQILHFALPGTVLGIYPTRGAISSHGAQALTDVVVNVMSRDRFERLCAEHPVIWMHLAWLFSRDCSLAYDRLTSIGRHSARKRVAHLLLDLYVRYSETWPGPRVAEMQLPLTQEHIADATGLSGVHVNRVLHRLREEGIAHFRYHRLRIINPDKLVDAAGIDPDLHLMWMRSRPPAK